jgi:hypothetical protein
MTANPVIVSAVENLSMIGAKPVEILLMKLFSTPATEQIGPFQPVHAGFAIRFA